MSIVDDFTRKLWIYLLKTKKEAFEKFKQWNKLVENQTKKKVKKLRTDNKLEHLSKQFINFCDDEDIAKHKIMVETPQHNGLAKRFNRTILERVKAMLFEAGLPKSFWGEAIMTTTYLMNKCSSTALGFKAPKEVCLGDL